MLFRSLVKDGRLHLIDVAFVQVRPSPWREAVDLANMMLVLALRTDAERVYQKALAYFTPDEIAEAFAAARGIASPTQLRTVMKQDGRDLLAQFRVLAPERRPIPLQRWGARRVLLIAALIVAALLVLPNVYNMFTPADLPVADDPTCGTNDVMTLAAQSVPSATAVPCIASFPAGWHASDVKIARGITRFRLETTGHEVEVTLRPPGDCPLEGAVEIPSDEVGMRRFEQPTQLPPNVQGTRTYVADGGCVTYDFSFAEDADASLVAALDAALAFQPRSELVAEVERESGLTLCGAVAPPCTGGSS